MKQDTYHQDTVLNLWFPNTGHEKTLETHAAFWAERMQGGMDSIIKAEFSELTNAAAMGLLDHWAKTARGRLALLIALDQFPRSLWRDTPAAYAQDIKAAKLALEGIKNGHFDVLEPWEQGFFVIAISHCEGPDHLERMVMLNAIIDKITTKMDDAIAPMRDRFKSQHARVLGTIEKFVRHPHRNEILGRVSSPEELAYIAKGEFPHLPENQ